jgi:hypothetical protein
MRYIGQAHIAWLPENKLKYRLCKCHKNDFFFNFLFLKKCVKCEDKRYYTLYYVIMCEFRAIHVLLWKLYTSTVVAQNVCGQNPLYMDNISSFFRDQPNTDLYDMWIISRRLFPILSCSDIFFDLIIYSSCVVNWHLAGFRHVKYEATSE